MKYHLNLFSALPPTTVFLLILPIWAIAGDIDKLNDDELLSLSLEELLNIKVETATKTAEKSSLSPAIMTVVTAQDITNYGYQSIAEVISHIAGFVDNHDLAMHNIGVRGINSGVRSGSRTIKFMIDGQAVAFRATSQNFIGRELIPMSLVERVEIVRGPVSALYGANAFLGVVNVITKKGQKLADEGAALTLKAESIDAASGGYQIDFAYGAKRDDWDYRLGFSYGDQDRGGIDLPKRSPQYDRQTNVGSLYDDTEPLSVYWRSNYQIAPNNHLKLSVYYQQLNTDNPFSDINPLQSSGHSHIGLDNMFTRLDWDKQLADNVNLHLFATYSEGDTLDTDKVEVGADSFYLVRRVGFDSFDVGAEMFINLREADSLLIGFDSKRDNQALETFTRVDRQSSQRTVLNPDKDKIFTDIGVYMQYIIQFNDNWKGLLGYRLDDDSEIGQQSSARLGVVGQLPYDLVLKVLAGSAFQTPSPELLFRDAVQSGDILGNPELDAQKADTVEISIAAPMSDVIHLTTTLFSTKVDNLVVFESDSSNLLARNATSSHTKGVELEARMLWQGIDAYFNYTYQNTERAPNPFSAFVLEHREKGDLFPEQMLNFGVTYNWSGIKFSWQSRWVDERPASTQNVLDINQFYHLDDYWVSDFSISTDKFSLISNKNTRLRLHINDVFDQQHVNPGFGGIEFPSLGRRFTLSLEQRF